jgi:hypothetical protein
LRFLSPLVLLAYIDMLYTTYADVYQLSGLHSEISATLLHISGGKPANNIITGCNGRIFRNFSAIRQARNCRGKVWIAEERDRLSQWGDTFVVTDLPGRRGNDTVQRGTQNIIAPTSKEVPHVYNNSSVLCMIGYDSPWCGVCDLQWVRLG